MSVFEELPGPRSGSATPSPQEDRQQGSQIGLTDEDRVFALELLSSMDRQPRFFKCPEVFLAAAFHQRTGVDLLTKFRLLDVIADTLDRPFTQGVRFAPAGDHQDLASPAAITMAGHLLDSGTLYSKPNGSILGIEASGGVGILRVRLSDAAVDISASEGRAFEQMERGLCRVARVLGIEDFEYPRRGTIRVPLTRGEDLAAILAGAHSEFGADRIVEDEIPICLFHGRTWEIRNILISTSEEPRIAGTYTKVGGGPLVANISQGGEGVDPRLFIDGLYRELYVGLDRGRITSLRDEFLDRVREEAIVATRAIGIFLRSEMAETFPALADQIYCRSLAIDVTGTLDGETGRLVPVIVEPNIAYGAEGLKKANMRTFIQVLHRLEQVETEGHQFLRSLIL